VAEGTPPDDEERYLTPAAVAGRFLARIDDVLRWIAEGRLRAERGGRAGWRIPESAVQEFAEQAYRRERYSGLDHGLHSWPTDKPEPSTNLPMPAQTAPEAEALAPRWPFPHG